MGLDSVELVMNVEERFDIKLPDSVVSPIQTVAELAAVVKSRLPTATDSCPSARGFCQVRRLMTTHVRIPRERIRPEARLHELFPGDRRRKWNYLHRHSRCLPQLVPTMQDRIRLELLCVALIILGAIAVALAAYAFGWRGLPFGSLIALFVGMMTAVWVESLLATQFPSGLVTIGDLSHMLAPIEIARDDSDARKIVEQRVVDEVRRLTAEQFNLPLNKVRPESRFRDLGLD